MNLEELDNLTTNVVNVVNVVKTQIKPKKIDVEVENSEIIPIKFTSKFVTNSLRQSNYDTESALSELVDNSIDADSSNITISIPPKKELESGKNAIIIHDDGMGMSLDELKQSFSFGSDREYFDGDIGNYGIGMKAAMAYLSQYVTVETKQEGSNVINIAIWDIDNDPLNTVFSQKLNEDENFISGTRIQMYCKWENTKNSRIEYFSHTQPAYIIKNFAARYFKALDKIKTSPNGDSLPKLKITVNGKDITPFDPMYRNNKNVKNMSIPSDEVEITVDDQKYIINVNGYYLGYVEPQGFDKNLKKAGFSYDNQGVYLLLNNKYIQIGGNWLGCRQSQHYLNATRVELEIPKELIEYFGISMNKNSVINLKSNNEETSVGLHTEKNKIINSIAKIGTWGEKESQNQRLSLRKNISGNQEKQATELSKILNKKAKEIGLSKPSKGIEKLPKSTKEQPESKGGEKNRPNNLKYDKELFKIDFFEGNKNDSFWKLEAEGKKTVILFNSNHSFYEKYINTDNSAIMMEFLCAMAMSELNSYASGDDYTIERWEDFWYDVSRWVNKFSWKEQKEI